jgi:L-malate glycosyltransferase
MVTPDCGVEVHRIVRPVYWNGLRKVATALYCVWAYSWIVLNRRRIDVVHAHIVSYQAMAAAYAARRIGVPCIVKVSSSGLNADYRRFLEGRGGAKVARLFTRFIATSELAAHELLSLGVAPQTIERIPNGVCLPSACIRDSGISKPLQVVCVASLRQVKAHEVLLDAWRMVSNEVRRNARLVLAGDGDLRGELESLAHAYGIWNEVVFAGEVRDVGSLLDQSDVFVLTSDAEGMSNALLEAMAHGLAPVVTDVGSNREVIGDAAAALVVPPRDSAQVAHRLEWLLTDPSARTVIGARARRRVEEHYGMDFVSTRYRALYEELLAAREQRRG